jgi:glycosyltransferase involved in cell wall biosynthesis
MKVTFLYPASKISPHPVHLAWAKAVQARAIQTPIGVGRFNYRTLKSSEVLLLESLYSAPFAKRFKKMNPECKVVSIIADTSFWKKKLGLMRKIYYWRYLSSVDGYLAVSERIKKDILSYENKPVKVVRPFFVSKYRIKRRGISKNILFIGHEVREKGYLQLVQAMKYLPEFTLYLIGDCCKGVKTRLRNIRLKWRVPRLNGYFRKCSFYVHPAEFDPCPVVVWEAMYAGLIPLITEGVGQSELFKGKLERLLLKDNAPKTIAEKIEEIYSASDVDALIADCKKLAERYEKEKSIEQFRVSFRKLLEAISRAPRS